MELFLDWHDWAAAEPELRGLVPETTADDVAKAVEFAKTWHGDQRRPTGAPYLEHLLEALQVLVTGAGVTHRDVLCAAVLHDVVEDTPCTIADVADAFGSHVAELVGWVTIPPVPAGPTDKDAGPADKRTTPADKDAVKRAYLLRLAGAPDDAKLVKLADRVSNVQTLRNLKPEKQRSYYTQTLTYIVPIAQNFPWFAGWYSTWQQAHQDLGE